MLILLPVTGESYIQVDSTFKGRKQQRKGKKKKVKKCLFYVEGPYCDVAPKLIISYVLLTLNNVKV